MSVSSVASRVVYFLALLPFRLPNAFVTCIVEAATFLWDNTIGILIGYLQKLLGGCVSFYNLTRSFWREGCNALNDWFIGFCGGTEGAFNTVILDPLEKSVPFGKTIRRILEICFLNIRLFVISTYKFLGYLIFLIAMYFVYVIVVAPALQFEGNLTDTLANVNVIGSGVASIWTIIAYIFDGIAFIWNTVGFPFIGRFVSANYQFIVSTFQNQLAQLSTVSGRNLQEDEDLSNRWFNYAIVLGIKAEFKVWGGTLNVIYSIIDGVITVLLIIYDIVVSVLGPVFLRVITSLLNIVTTILCALTPASHAPCIIVDYFSGITFGLIPACAPNPETPCRCGTQYGGPFINAPPCEEETYSCVAPVAPNFLYREFNTRTGVLTRSGTTEASGCPNYVKSTGSSSKANSGRRALGNERNREREERIVESIDTKDVECYNQCFITSQTAPGWYFHACDHKKLQKTETEYTGACDSNGNPKSFPTQFLHVQHYEKFVGLRQNTTVKLGQWHSPDEPAKAPKSTPRLNSVWTFAFFQKFYKRLLNTVPDTNDEVLHVRCNGVANLNFEITPSDFALLLFQQFCIAARIVNIYHPYMMQKLLQVSENDRAEAKDAFDLHKRRVLHKKHEIINETSPHLGILWKHANLNMNTEYITMHDMIQRFLFFHDDLVEVHKEWAVKNNREISIGHASSNLANLTIVAQKLENRTEARKRRYRKLFIGQQQNLGALNAQQTTLNFNDYYMCPNGIIVLKSELLQKCNMPGENEWTLMAYVRFLFYQVQVLPLALTPLKLIVNTGRCFRKYEYTPSTFPYSSTNMQYYYTYGEMPKGVVFCFPMSLLQPLPYVPTLNYYANWFTDLCNEVYVQNGGSSPCNCGSRYAPQTSILDDNQAMVGGFPVKFFNRLNQAMVNSMWVISYFVSFVPVISDIWYSIFSLFAFIPWFPEAIPNLLNVGYWSDGLSESRITFCFVIHIGSFLWSIWFLIIFYIVIKCYWEFALTLFTSLLSPFSYLFDSFYTRMGVRYVQNDRTMEAVFTRGKDVMKRVFGRTTWGKICGGCKRLCKRNEMSKKEQMRLKSNEEKMENTMEQLAEELNRRTSELRGRLNRNANVQIEEDETPFLPLNMEKGDV